MSFKPISTFHNHAIDTLTAKLTQQHDLLSLVQQALPSELAAHTVYCVAHDTALVVYTEAAVWSSQLRFHKAAMLAAAIPAVPALTHVQIRLLARK